MRVAVFVLLACLGSLLPACSEGPAPTVDAEPPVAAAPSGGDAAADVVLRAGEGYPPVPVDATADAARVRVLVPLESNSVKERFQAGALVSAEQEGQSIVPRLTVLTDIAGKEGPTDVDFAVAGLRPFGDLSVPLFYNGRQIETLRFRKTGLVVRPPSDGPIVAHEKDGRLLLVLENRTGQDFVQVRLRVRFQGTDVCTVSSDQATPATPAAASPRWWQRLGLTPANECPPGGPWATVNARASSQVSVWVPTRDDWFQDRLSGMARSALRPGVLTLRYGTGGAAAEQNLPLEVRFEPTSWHLWRSILWIGFLLLLGAVLFLLLRVSIPNYRRKKAIKDTLNEIRATTAGISNAVNSQLRVLLRVERLTLDQRRREGWVLLPGFEELATRIEAGASMLSRRVDLTRRLDAATCRRDSLVAGAIAPTRLAMIDRELTSACEVLKGDQLADTDWLFIRQRLETADKLLNDPSPEEKEAFEALLAQRWQAVRDYFGQTAPPDQADPELLALRVPAELEAMRACFPRAAMLPRSGDSDGRAWIAAIGVVRADLQLTGLEILKDIQFLAPDPPSPEWTAAMGRLTRWLATPSIDNLSAARALVEQLSEPATVDEMVAALQDGRASIEMDPQLVAPNQTVKLSVRFLEPRLNASNLRDAIQCEWTFEEAPFARPAVVAQGRWSRLWGAMAGFGRREDDATAPVPQRERGWVAYRYFEPDVAKQTLTVRFLHEGRELTVAPEVAHVHYQKVVEPAVRGHSRKEHHEKWLRFGFQTAQMLAGLLVPLATMAIATAGDGTSGRWWDIVALGFGSEAIRNILTGEQSTPNT